MSNKFYVIAEDGGQAAPGFDCVLKALARLRVAAPYSFLVREDGTVLSRRLPPFNPSRKRMERAEQRYELRRVGRAQRESNGAVQ